MPARNAARSETAAVASNQQGQGSTVRAGLGVAVVQEEALLLLLLRTRVNRPAQQALQRQHPTASPAPNRLGLQKLKQQSTSR
jgi:hypothetical protein